MINTGDPVILTDAKGLKKYGLRKGIQGYANSVVHVPEEDNSYIQFMPDGTRQMFIISLDRVELDEERMKEEAGE